MKFSEQEKSNYAEDLLQAKEYSFTIKEILIGFELRSFNYSCHVNQIRCQILRSVSLRTLNIIQQKTPNYDLVINTNNGNIELVFERILRF